jgi:hypothetical protein
MRMNATDTDVAYPRSTGLRAGFGLVEIVVALMLLSIGIIGVASTGSAVRSQMGSVRTNLQLWAGLQSVADSLQAVGFGGVAAGSRSIGAASFSWTVDASVPYLESVVVRGWSTGPFPAADTIVVFVASPNAP